MSSEPVVYEDAAVTVRHSVECGVPGYVVLRVGGEVLGLGELAPAQAAEVGRALARTAAAVAAATAAERVYCLSFCELDRRLHFHLFPRTAWLLEAWRAGSGRADVDGPALFLWARQAYPPGAALPDGVADVGATCSALRAALVP